MDTGEAVLTSYDAGQQPYVHDPKRGKWRSQWDFYAAFFANAFTLHKFAIVISFTHSTGGIYSIFPFIIATLISVIPIFFVQSFLGQFSSTGYISVFRLSPLFKGVGYLILGLNFVLSLYSSAIAGSAFLYFLHSFQLNTTWMYCDNSWNTPNCAETQEWENSENGTSNYTPTDSILPLYEYYLHGIMRISHEEHIFEISWTIILAQLVTWTLIGLILYRGMRMLENFLRYATIVMSVIALIIFIRICCLPGASDELSSYFQLDGYKRLADPVPWIIALLLCSLLVDKGWGTTLTLASYQPFKTNLQLYSYAVPLGLCLVLMVNGLMMYIIDAFMKKNATGAIHAYDLESEYMYVFIAFPYVFGKIEASQMWSMLFFGMAYLADFSFLVILTFSIITAISDEFAQLRHWKSESAVVLCVTSFVLSTAFATKYISDAMFDLTSAHFANRMLICFLELMIVVWIYGRERFLRDVQFILGRNIPPWTFYILRFVTPTFIFFSGLFYVTYAATLIYYQTSSIKIFVGLLKGIPWILIPVYIAVKMSVTIGTVPERFKKCTRPTDWYPADPADKEKYDLAVGVSDISQNLLEMNENHVF